MVSDSWGEVKPHDTGAIVPGVRSPNVLIDDVGAVAANQSRAAENATAAQDF